jgi:predicted phosphodiesterase
MSYEDGIWLLNPGSAGCPRDEKYPSFGTIDVSEYGVLVNIADV